MSERNEARRGGDRLQPNSGRSTHAKADAVNRDLVIDYKEYERGFRLTKPVWAKITSDAWMVDPDKYPVLKIVLGATERLRLVVMQQQDFEAVRRPEGCQCG